MQRPDIRLINKEIFPLHPTYKVSHNYYYVKLHVIDNITYFINAACYPDFMAFLSKHWIYTTLVKYRTVRLVLCSYLLAEKFRF